jgi:hypothetical protein
MRFTSVFKNYTAQGSTIDDSGLISIYSNQHPGALPDDSADGIVNSALLQLTGVCVLPVN